MQVTVSQACCHRIQNIFLNQIYFVLVSGTLFLYTWNFLSDIQPFLTTPELTTMMCLKWKQPCDTQPYPGGPALSLGLGVRMNNSWAPKLVSGKLDHGELESGFLVRENSTHLV